MADNRIFRPKLLTPHRIWKVKQAWKNNRSLRWFTLTVLLVIIAVVAGSLIPLEPESIVVEKPVEKVVTKTQDAPAKFYRLSAEDGILVGRYGNALDLKGEYSKRYSDATASVSVDPEGEFGVVEVLIPKASFNPEDQARLEGDIKIVVNRFKPVESWQREGVALDETLFGDTGRGFDLLPTTRAYLAAYGEADVLLDEQEVYGNIEAMVIYSEGIRDEDGMVTKDGELYATKHKSEQFGEASDRELHIFVYRDLEDKKNFPQKNVWMEVYFEEPRVIEAPPGAKK